MKTPGVYRIFNKITKRSYVGSSSTDWRNRRNGHVHLLRMNKHPSKRMQDDWNAHGPDSFMFFCVCECAAEAVLDLEEAACQEFGAFTDDKGYNTQPIAGPRFRGGRPKGNAIRFSRMVSPERANKIVELLQLEDGELLQLELGSIRKWLGQFDGQRKHIKFTELHPHHDSKEWHATFEERQKPHPLTTPDSSTFEVERLRRRVSELEAKVREFESMYA